MASGDVTGGCSGAQQTADVTALDSTDDHEDATLFEGELEDKSKEESVEVSEMVERPTLFVFRVCVRSP